MNSKAKEIAVIINDLEETINTEVKDAGPGFLLSPRF